MLAGEPIDVLVRALASFEWTRKADGMVRVSASMDPELGRSFLRALERMEQELLVGDTERIGNGDTVFRTSEQRRADALVALVLRLADARRMG